MSKNHPKFAHNRKTLVNVLNGRIWLFLKRERDILGFHVTSEKTKSKIFSFYLYQVKVIFKHISVGSVDRFEHVFFAMDDIGIVSW